MQSGRFNTRFSVKRPAKVADGFGGFTETESNPVNFWGYFTEKKGIVSGQDGLLIHKVTTEVVVRKNTGDLILTTDFIQFEGDTTRNFRIGRKYDSTQDYYTTLELIET